MLRAVSREVFRVCFYLDPLGNAVLYFFCYVMFLLCQLDFRKNIFLFFFASRKCIIFGFQNKKYLAS